MGMVMPVIVPMMVMPMMVVPVMVMTLILSMMVADSRQPELAHFAVHLNLTKLSLNFAIAEDSK